MQWVGILLLVIIVGSMADNLFYHAGPGTYRVYASSTSPTGYAINRRYYDFDTNTTYVASSPVATVAYVPQRLPRGTVYSGSDAIPPFGIQPRSY